MLYNLTDKIKIIMKYPQLKDMKMIGNELQVENKYFHILNIVYMKYMMVIKFIIELI